ncbi:hypothetical protein J6590_044124, partial [Homalodisca vitripennis]
MTKVKVVEPGEHEPEKTPWMTKVKVVEPGEQEPEKTREERRYKMQRRLEAVYWRSTWHLVVPTATE